MITETIQICIEQLINRNYPKLHIGANTTIVDKNGCPISPLAVEVPSYIDKNPKWGKIDRPYIAIAVAFEQDSVYPFMFDYEQLNSASGDTVSVELARYLPQGVDVVEYSSLLNLFSGVSVVSGYTDSKLDVVRSYSISNPYPVGVNTSNSLEEDWTGVLSFNSEAITYVVGGKVDDTGNWILNSGVIYKTYHAKTRVVTDGGVRKEIPLTEFFYYPEATNATDVELSNLLQKEENFGLAAPVVIDDDIDVDRGTVSVAERHLRLSEISNMEQLVSYNGNYFRVS